MLEKLLYIFVGAVLGACARYLLSNYIAKQASAAFPFGTLLINITGSMLLGFFTDCSDRAPKHR